MFFLRPEKEQKENIKKFFERDLTENEIFIIEMLYAGFEKEIQMQLNKDNLNKVAFHAPEKKDTMYTYYMEKKEDFGWDVIKKDGVKTDGVFYDEYIATFYDKKNAVRYVNEQNSLVIHIKGSDDDA